MLISPCRCRNLLVGSGNSAEVAMSKLAGTAQPYGTYTNRDYDGSAPAAQSKRARLSVDTSVGLRRPVLLRQRRKVQLRDKILMFRAGIRAALLQKLQPWQE